MNFGRSFSYDSSSAASSCINSAVHTGHVKDLDAVSPKLRSFFSFNDNHAIQDIDERYPMGLSGGGRKNDLVLLPTQLLDESTSDGSSVSILHNIFSPKFHAQSAKKKGMPKSGRQEHRQHQQQHHSVFSPVSAASTPGRSHYDANASAISEMSDEFSTIHAILRGDTLDNIKKSVGLDGANHPLRWSSSGGGSNKSSINVEDHRDRNYKGELVSKVANHHATNADDGKRVNMQNGQHSSYGDENVDDSTEVMLDTARLFASEGVKTAVHHSPNTNVFSAHGYHRYTQSIAGGHVTKTKTPKGSSPMSNEEFYTPTSPIESGDVSYGFVPRSSSSNPKAIDFDFCSGGQMTGLPPVWEEDEWKTNNYDASAQRSDGRDHPHHDHDSTTIDEDQSTSSIDVKDFRTPKQRGSDWKVDHNDHEDDDEEEFFSPLAQHAGHTPPKKNGAYDSNYIMNTMISSLTAFDFNDHAKLVDNRENVTATQSEVQSSAMPPAVTTAPAERVTTSSPRNSAMAKAEKLKGAPLPEKSPSAFDSNLSNMTASGTPVYHLGYPQDSNTLHSPISFHLHSPSVSNLSPDALTVDFVKSCNCIETLNTILCLLSDENKFTSHRHNGKRGKQLRYPSLVRLVEKQLQRVQTETSRSDPNEDQQQTQAGGGQSVQLLPRVVARGKVLRYPENDGSDKENVDPRKEEITRNYHLPMQSVTVSHDSKNDGEENYANANQNGSPSLTYGSISMSKSSLDMNLSESMLFTLDDESHYWKHGAESVEINCNDDSGDTTRGFMAESTIAAEQREHKESQAKDEDDILERYVELEDKLAATLSSNARLTSEIDSLVEKQNEIKAELSAKLERMTKQLSQQQGAAASDNAAHQGKIAELDRMNRTLRGEIQRLDRQLHIVNKKAEKTSQLQSEREDAKMSLAHDKEILETTLDEFRAKYETMVLDKLKLVPEIKSAEKMQHFLKSAKLANKALAEALAASEHDLAEANATKGKSERECDSLRKHVLKLEDKAAFLSSKVKEMSTELESSHAYIDELYADLEMSQGSCKELKDTLVRRELEWKELERGYSHRISELEAKIRSDSTHKVSMDAYMSVIKQTRHYKIESMKSQETIDSLKDQLEMVQKSSAAMGVGKRALQNIEVPKVPPSNAGAEQQSVAKRDIQQGKQLNRVAVIRAAGGRKGLSEQLKRARGVSPSLISPKEQDVPTSKI